MKMNGTDRGPSEPAAAGWRNDAGKSRPVRRCAAAARLPHPIVAVLVFVLIFVSAASAEAPAQFSFATRILPVLTHAGCNAGACHGAATGQGGFKLSLLGYDPAQDHETISRELGGRRIDLGAPDQSLLLRKPTRQLEHEGGRRLQRDSESYRALLDWIARGAPYGASELELTRLTAAPADLLLLRRGKSHPLQVQAHLSDGTVEDVTRLALYSSQDDAVAAVDRTGVVTVNQRGVTSIMIRYSGQVAAVRVGAPFQDTDRKTSAPVAARTEQFIDALTAAEWKRLRLPPSPLADELTLFRRLHLDIAGRLPSSAEVQEYLAQPVSARQREVVMERLLRSEEFVDFWTMKLADWLLLNSKRIGDKGARAYHAWLRNQVATSAPLDRVVRALLTAQGEVSREGPPNFHKVANDPRDMGEFVGQALLGTRVACARCHNHPFDRWTMEDYHRFAAYFARTGFENGQLVQRTVGEVQHPKTGKDVTPRPLGGLAPSPALSTGSGQAPALAADRRVALAAWLTAPENPFFARAVANRIWRELMGRGLVEPVDDLRPTNPASIPALLDALGTHFVEQGYDLRKLVRTIVSSRVYALSSQPNAINRQDDRFFSRAYPKPLTAQVLADAIAQATGVPDEFNGYSAGTRAVALIDPQVPSYALDVFGRCPRTTACEGAAQPGGGLAATLHLVNGPAINDKTGAAVDGILAKAPASRDAIRELYLRTLSRPPTRRERSHWERSLAQGTSQRETLEDLLWALLNSREFAFNH